MILTVISGKVAFSGVDTPEARLELGHGEQAALSARDGSLSKAGNDNRNFLAWKTGILVFENDSLEGVCRILSNHYKRDILPGKPDTPKRLTATFDNRELEDVLTVLPYQRHHSGFEVLVIHFPFFLLLSRSSRRTIFFG